MKAYLLEVSIQCGYAGMFVITMVSLNHGMSHYVLAVYRHVVATLVIAPFALLLERSKYSPSFSLPALTSFFCSTNLMIKMALYAGEEGQR